jgi:hypothetical protein
MTTTTNHPIVIEIWTRLAAWADAAEQARLAEVQP